MATKKELLTKMTKAKLMELAESAGVATVKATMKKDEMVEVLSKTTKVKKSDLED